MGSRIPEEEKQSLADVAERKAILRQELATITSGQLTVIELNIALNFLNHQPMPHQDFLRLEERVLTIVRERDS